MKKIELGQTITVLANLGVIAGIIFLVIELNQAQVIARLEIYASLEGSAVNGRDAINQNAEIWTKGATGQQLSASEELVFGNLVRNLNEQAINQWSMESELNNESGAELVLHDFAAFLQQNPGARRVWLAREDMMNRTRQILGTEDGPYWAFWRADVSEAMKVLDANSQ